MKVFVTGATGFIGRHVCKKLVERGFDPIAITEPGIDTAGISCSESLSVDLCKIDEVQKAIRPEADMLIHLAAIIPKELNDPRNDEIAKINLQIDKNVFSVCSKAGIGVVFASSASVYGWEGTEIKTEDSKATPTDFYAKAKLQSESLGKKYFATKNAPFTSLRIAAPYGCGQRFKTVMHIFIERAIKDQPLLYYGTGSRQQDFVNIGDVAEAFVIAVEKRKSGTFNIASGKPVTMKQLAETIIKCIPGSRSVIKAASIEDPQEKFTALFNIDKAKKELGWTPKVTLEKGIADLADKLKS